MILQGLGSILGLSNDVVTWKEGKLNHTGLAGYMFVYPGRGPVVGESNSWSAGLEHLHMNER